MGSLFRRHLHLALLDQLLGRTVQQRTEALDQLVESGRPRQESAFDRSARERCEEGAEEAPGRCPQRHAELAGEPCLLRTVRADLAEARDQGEQCCEDAETEEEAGQHREQAAAHAEGEQRAVVEDVPAPRPEPGRILVEVSRSCISIGTEMSGISSSGTPLWKRALKDPWKIRKALEMATARGVGHTARVIRGEMEAGSATGYLLITIPSGLLLGVVERRVVVLR